MKIFGASSFAACLYGILAAFALLAAPAAGAATISLSGTWDFVSHTPSCNYTEYDTLVFTYANGSYSVTGSTNNSRGNLGGGCSNDGAASVTFSNFYTVAQDLLTESQLLALFGAAFSNDPMSDKYLSVTFTSPDSVSGTAIGGDGRSQTFTMTRAASTTASASDIVGSWRAENIPHTATITFSNDGTYSMVETGTADLSGQSGSEGGTYSWNPTTGALTYNTTSDTTGQWGLSHSGAVTITISGNTLTLNAIDGTTTWIRVASAPTLNTLAVTRSGSGTITSNTGGINCGTSCWADYTSGTSVSLTATPASGSNFTGWSGDCSGTGPCVVTMSAAKNVTATFNPVPFTVTVTGVTNGIITAPVATVTATINVNTADVGRAGAVYITAWIPASALGTVLPTGSASGTLTVKSARGSVSSMTVAALANADTGSYVLVQLTTSGWQAVVNGQLIPYTSGTLAEQSAALTILNNTDTASLPGAQICVGYGIGDTTSANAAEMVRNGNMQLIASVPDTNANSASMGSCILSANYTDSWYNANESGWGLTITDHDTNAFVQWYTYDQTGHNQKYVISGGTFSNGKCLFSGDIKRITGPSWTLPTFDSAQVTRTTVGSGTIDFCPTGLTAGSIVFDYTAEGVTGSKQLARLSFGNDVPHWGGTTNTGARDFSDLWWNSSESGWGVSVTQHGNNLFFRVFAYDTDNRPLLFIVPGVTFNSSTSFTGNLVLTSGPWYGTTPFDPTRVTRTTAGTATLTFSDANNGVLSYTVNGVTVTKTITRVVF